MSSKSKSYACALESWDFSCGVCLDLTQRSSSSGCSSPPISALLHAQRISAEPLAPQASTQAATSPAQLGPVPEPEERAATPGATASHQQSRPTVTLLYSEDHCSRTCQAILYDGRLDWPSVLVALGATAAIVEEPFLGTPALLRDEGVLGLTRDSFEPGQVLKLDVTKKTPDLRDLLDWLPQHPLAPFPTREQCKRYLDCAPLSPEVLQFLKEHLQAVPPAHEHFRCRRIPEEGAFDRPDFQDLFNRRTGLKAALIYGRHQLGKSAIPREAVRWREQVLKGRDRCVFYHPGWPDPPLDLQIINHMLAHMRILCLFNQFTESLFGHAHSFEDFLQSLERQHCNDLAPLGFVFISSYPGFAAFNEALPSFVAMSEYGLHQFKVPDPPLGLLLGLAMQRAAQLKLDFQAGFAQDFLRRVTLFGWNIASHDWLATPAEGLTYLTSRSPWDRMLHPSDRIDKTYLVAFGQGARSAHIFELKDANIIQEKRGSQEQGPAKYEFTDPPLLAWQLGTLKDQDLEAIEGRVLGRLLRDPICLLPPLLKILGIQQAEPPTMYTGQLTADSEFDGLFAKPHTSSIANAA